jgi:oligopeptidase A
MNPLLDFSGLPRFDEIRVEHIAPAIDQLLNENRAVKKQIVENPEAPTWDNLMQPLEDASEKLSRAWGQVSHLNSVMNSPELREAYNAYLPKITEFYTELSQDADLFNKYKILSKSNSYKQLSGAQKKIIENELRDFRLGGAELPDDKKLRFKNVREELASLSSKFEENVLDATNAFALYRENQADLKGIPEDALESAQHEAQKDNKPGWKFTLHAPSWMPVMQYAENRSLREEMYRAYVTRASEFGKAEWDNSGIIVKILKLRQELAQLLGFKNYAEVSLEPKMATSPKQVLDFLNELAVKGKPFAVRDLDELKEFAAKKLNLAKLEAWDIAYASEKLRVERYNFSDQEVKQYFPETKVLPGMFKVVETIYGLSIAPSKTQAWHPDVRFFDIKDASNKLIGQFYVDLYARASKRGGAWMDDAITRRRTVNAIQTPVAYLNCNFSAPLGNQPALFTHDEVITLFHEFGHGLHHLLTKVEDLGVSGINGVEWDAVELPSQFMENFCWEWDVLKHMSSHIESGEALPRALFDKMLAAKNFQSGMFTMRQLEFALFDMHMHYDFDANKKTVLDLLNDIRSKVAVVLPPSFNRFPHSFNHIFSGGYAAGYYSYKWAEVLSADAYSMFEENGVLNAQIGARFRNEILSVGGSRPALESFIAFRGREPSIEPLLRHNGMV